jgi:hypothetical protein
VGETGQLKGNQNMNAIEIAREIVRGNFTPDDHRVISDALRAAYRRDRQVRLEKAQEELNQGDTVRISNIRPRILDGAVGTVGRMNGSMTRVDVTITMPLWGRNSWKYPVGKVVHGVPMSCLTKVEKHAPEDVTRGLKRARRSRLQRARRNGA